MVRIRAAAAREGRGVNRDRVQRTALLLVAAGLLSGVLLWSWRDGADAVQAAGDPARVPVVGQRLPHASRSTSPLPEGRFDEVRRELEGRAAAGDAEAAYRLASVMAVCRGYRPVGNAMLADMLVSTADLLRRSLRIGGRVVEEQAALELVVHGKALLDRTCAGATGLAESTTPADDHRWMHRAAALGHSRAKAEYASVAFVEYNTDAALLDDAAEVARRRARARRLLDEALAAGEPAALAAAARWHGRDGPGSRDPVRALAYWLAWLSTDDGREMPEAASRMATDVHARGLSPTELRRAERMAGELVARGHPEGPP